MMMVSVNNEKKNVADAITIEQLLQQCGFESHRIAVAVNAEFVSRTEYNAYALSDNDRVDILAPVQGG